MVVEARFAIPDLETYERLRSLDHLDPFTVQPPVVEHLDDHYLDTEDRRIAHAGYTCRLRREGDVSKLIFAKRETPDPPFHRFEPLISDLPGGLLPHQLLRFSDGPAMEALREIVADATLDEVVHVRRTLERRRVALGDRVVAELRQDTVQQTVRDADEEFLDLTVRLEEAATEADLVELVAALRSAYALMPQPVSRYQRGLAVAGHVPDAEPLLTHPEYQLLKELACGARRYARRARALMALHHGATQVEAGAYAGLTDRRVRHWLAEFRKKRMGIFPPSVRSEAARPREGSALSGHGEGNGYTPGDAAAASAVAAVSPSTAATTAAAEAAVPTSDPEPDDEVLDPDDTMAAAARKTLRHRLSKMVDHEAGTRVGKDPEELHDMRVATRRMRAAAGVFKRYVSKRALKPHLRGLRRTAKVLGRVRDLDVAIEKARAFETSEQGHGADLAPLLEAWLMAHRSARADLVDYLDSAAYEHFKDAYRAFLDRPLPLPKRLRQPETVVPVRLRHVAPIEIYSRLAEVRAYDAVLPGPNVALEHYHNLRIAFKRLRYTLEFFEEILGPEVREAIEEAKQVQDYLGDFQDAVVASDRLRNFWLWGTWAAPEKGELARSRMRSMLAPGVARYHTAKQLEIQAALDGFAQVWEQYKHPEFCQLIARAVSVL